MSAADWSPSEPLDLGDGREFRFVGPADPDGHPIGGIEVHRRPDGQPCEGYITFASAPERWRRGADGNPKPSWTVESWEPLTLSPSLLCTQCGNHGFVRGDRWVPA